MFAAEARDVGLVVGAVGAGPVAPVVGVGGGGGEGDAVVVWRGVGKGGGGAVVGYVLFVESRVRIMDAQSFMLAGGIGRIMVRWMSYVICMYWYVVMRLWM